MMTFDLSSFLDGTDNVYRFNGELDNNGLDYDSKNFKIIGPISYYGEVFKVDGDYLIQADIFYKYDSNCDRCLKPATKETKTTLSGKLIEGKGNNDDDDYSEEIIYYENDLLDLDDYIKSQVIMSIPMKVLCSKECKGFCSICGTNLNEESCNCSQEIIDPRLEKLKDFFLKK